MLCARGDGTGFLSPDTSRGKAVAAAAFRRTTKEMAETAREHRAVLERPVRPRSGRDPAQHGRRPDHRRAAAFIGAIGCGGGTGEQDHQCALAGAAAV